MKIPKRPYLIYTGIIFFAILFLLPMLGSVHLFDWDEINFAESAREMIVTGEYLTVQINYEPFWEKPPLFFWLQSLSMKVFGINEFAARFPNVVCGIVTLIMLYYIGQRIYNHRFGVLWVLSYGAAILPFFYFKSGIIDPWFNLFIFMGFAWFIFYLDPQQRKKRLLNVSLSALFIGLAVLTKGPVAILVFILGFLAFLVSRRFRLITTAGHVITFIVILTLTGGLWFLLQILDGNMDIIRDFIEYQIRLFSNEDAGHGGFFMYHFVIVLVGVFPASILFLTSFTKKSENTELQRLFRSWMYILFWLVLILFSVVETKIIHYSSLSYYPMTFLAAWVWEKWIDRKLEIRRWQVVLITFIALIYSALTLAIPLMAANMDWVLDGRFSFISPFWQEALKADVHWSGWEALIGVFFLVGVIYSIRLILRRELRGMLILHMVSLLFVSFTVYIFTPRIEGYSQRAAIEFYKEHAGEDAYMNTLGFKSYAHLFYFEKQPPEHEHSNDTEWIMNNKLDKEAYFVIQVHKKERFLEEYPGLEVLYEKNGFVFTRLKQEETP